MAGMGGETVGELREEPYSSSDYDYDNAAINGDNTDSACFRCVFFASTNRVENRVEEQN